MANITELQMEVFGKKKNLEVFAKWIRNTVDLFDDNKSIKQNEVDRHIGSSIMSIDGDDIEIKEVNSEKAKLCFSSENNGDAYKGLLDEIRDEYDSSYISIAEACEILNVECELFCFDSGLWTVEHYVVNNNGQLTTDEELDCVEYLLDDYDEYDDLIEEYDDCELDEESFSRYKGCGFYRECEIWDQEELTWRYQLDKKGGE